MTELSDVLYQLGRWSLPAVWLPVLAWTLLAAPIYALLQRVDRWHPLVRYRLLQALLFALPVGCAAAAWIDASALVHGLAALAGASETPDGQVVLPSAFTLEGVAAGASGTPSFGAYHAVGLLTALALLAAAAPSIRLVRSALAIPRLRAASARADGRVQQQTDALAAALAIRRPVAVRLTSRAAVPMTHGVVRPSILLPAALTARPDALRMTLAHELVHVRRLDFLARCAEQLVAAAFAVHPGVARLVRAIESAREIACDAEAIRRTRCSRQAYADLLCGFVAVPHPSSAFALSIAESSSLKQRIRAMTTFDRFANRIPRYTPVLAAVLLVLLGLGIVACSDAVTPPTTEDAPEEAVQQSTTAPNDEVFVVVEERPELIGGIEALQEAVEYPEAAKQAGVEGRVFVQFVVNEEGRVQDAQVTRGAHELLDRAAVEAVQGLTFEPGMHRGEPVKVQFVLPVTFRLPSEGATP